MQRAMIWGVAAYGVVTLGALAALLAQVRVEIIASREAVLAALVRVTAIHAAEVVRDVAGVLQLVREGMAESPAAASNGEEIAAWLRKVSEQRPGLRDLYILDEFGRIAHETAIGSVGLDVSDRAYFQQHRANPGLGFDFGEPIKSKTKGTWAIPATLALRHRDGEFAGVIVAIVEPQFFNQVWAFDRDVPGIGITLTNAKGRILARRPFAEYLMSQSYIDGSLPDRLAAGGTAAVYQVRPTFADKDHLVAIHALPGYPNLYNTVGQPMDDVLTPWWRTVWIVVVGWLITTGMLAGLAASLASVWNAHRAADRRFRDFFNFAPDAMLIASREGAIKMVNRQTETLFGWTHAELIDQPVEKLIPKRFQTSHVDLRESYAEDAAPRSMGAMSTGQYGLRKDGTEFPVEISLGPIDGDTPGEGKMVGAAVRDITVRVEAESARLTVEAQLRQAQKMEAVGQLTGGIAHDFNNILTVILANADTLQEEETLNPDVTARLQEIASAVQRAADLTRSLMVFSRKQTFSAKPTNINDLVAAIGKLLHRSLGEHIELDSMLAEDLWIVDIDRAQLETALVNLCINARDAMAGGGRLLIETKNAVLDEEYAALNPEAVPGEYALLAVSDTGSGMPPDVLAKVFEPFFTTKEVGKGTGLGLSMVYGFIKQSNGHIKVYSEVGQGTTFRLYLPRSPGMQSAPSAEPGLPPPRGTERILLVEDDPRIRAAIARQLCSLGYDVSDAADGAAGLASFENAAAPFDLLLTDVVMPGRFNGKTLADEVTRRWPDTKVVFMSGYSEHASVLQAHIDTDALLLSKPFRKIDLAKIIRLALDGNPAVPLN